jgi:cobyrinic acid a,c-diamide synthase
MVEGSFSRPSCGSPAGGDLETLCEWLDLPRVAIVDAASLGSCQLPERPRAVDGLLLDRVADATQAARLQTHFESLWNAPVVGWLGLLEGPRGLVAATPPGSKPALDLCHALGCELARHADLDRFYRMARHRKFPAHRAPQHRRYEGQPLRVAVAYDDAFHCYFPDTLDLLELKGATICDFSPLRDERLPPGTDVVYFGCGFPDMFAQQLAENNCMILALKSHLSSGRRVYAEGGGLAYLCQRIALADGQSWPMVGAVSATAQLNAQTTPPRPAEMTVARDTWLGQAPLHWAGYLSQRWSLRPGPAVGCGQEAGRESDIVGQHQAVGSRLHMNFAAREELLDRFFEPHSVCNRSV